MSAPGERSPASGGGRPAARRAVIASLLVLTGGLLAVLAAGSIARTRQGFTPLFLLGVLLLGSILTLVVVFVLGRSVVKLYLERSRGVAGSGYRTKVISLVAGLTLLPCLALFAIASGVLRAAVEQWFEPEVESVLGDGKALLDFYEAEEAARGLRSARLLAGDIAGRSLLTPRGRKQLPDLLASERERLGLAGVRAYDGRGRLVAESYEPRREDQLHGVSIPESALRELLLGQHDSMRHSPERRGELLLFLGVPVVASEGGPPAGVAVAVTALGAAPSAALARINEHWETYQQARANREAVQQGFILVLALFTLLLLFSAVWVGSALAKSMTVPIQSLAEATRAVSEGRLDVRVDVDAPDEVGLLVRSFNRMLDELRTGRLNVERSTLDLQRSNVELEKRRTYIETILESSPAGVVSLDHDGRITNMNRAAVEMLRLRERVELGVHYRDLFSARDFLGLRVQIENVMAKPRSYLKEFHVGELHVSFRALLDADDRFGGLILVVEDLSELLKAQKLAAWAEVARRIAHEFKNPLTPIQLSAQRILKKWRAGDPDVGPVIEECAETIAQYVDGLKEMVNEFSRFARMPPVNRVPAQLDKLVHNALVLYEGHHPELQLVRRVSPDIPTMSLDPEQMKRVLINLVDNAIHCQNGAGTVTVTAAYDGRTQSARIEVSDEGPGIPREDRDKLFVPYFSTKKSGTGLGLAIVQRIVFDHDGRIRVEDNLPRGTRFVIDLPA